MFAESKKGTIFTYQTKKMTQEQISQKVAEMKAKGCKLPDEQIVSIIMKQGTVSKKSAAGFARREETKNVQAGNLWGPDCEFSTQAEYQASLLGSKWNKK